MQTKISQEFQDKLAGQEAEQILRQCVHCGMCNATCPTYQLLGDELDGPRGRIYLIKQVLEGQTPTQRTQTHLDRCLTCRSCETTCPSGVKYGRLLEIGREIVEKKVGRKWTQKIVRAVLKTGLSNPRLFQHALSWGRQLQVVLPERLSKKIPVREVKTSYPETKHTKQVILLDGCVQGSLAPNINAATARVLDRFQIQSRVVPEAGCCGAIRLHLSDIDTARENARRNIDAWWPLIGNETVQEESISHILMTASGCGVMVKDYGNLLAHDDVYASKAKKISEMTLDLSEFLLIQFSNQRLQFQARLTESIVWHAPCSLQHGQAIKGKVESIFHQLGVVLQSCQDSHLCCGSAGTYSILQSDLARRLRDNKLSNLLAANPDRIVSANMACQLHLASGTSKPVVHWIEVLDQALQTKNLTITSVALEGKSEMMLEPVIPAAMVSTDRSEEKTSALPGPLSLTQQVEDTEPIQHSISKKSSSARRKKTIQEPNSKSAMQATASLENKESHAKGGGKTQSLSKGKNKSKPSPKQVTEMSEQASLTKKNRSSRSKKS
ncbi:glycolate oxidase subunit GlcF [Undibacterium fentianense]|uniref:Glycolate oxidase subunit GlcF n=1 Tax=Undibacterium fentianense TaxID=2828728 RepID=A0A941DZ33_9BURK|nr:glycolate oxidase subunit GlcF [Undibacterium fentianense]MBR7799435.1 glycolate oxidase subunit GlcF [Undibacterium fentianense]